MLTQDQINEAVSSALPDVLAGLKREITESALYNAKQTAVNAVNTAVTEWVKEQIVPEILKTLVESKDGLIQAAPAMAEGLVEQMAKSFTETVSKKLENSWERKKIFEALIG